MLVSSGQTAFAPAFAALHKQCFDHPWSVAEWSDLLHLPTTIGWLTEQSFLLCSHVADEMEILTIGVIPSVRRQGIASALLQELLTYARAQGVHRVFLEVSAHNPAAQALYARYGFVRTGTRPNYYQTSSGLVDALCLTCPLN